MYRSGSGNSKAPTSSASSTISSSASQCSQFPLVSGPCSLHTWEAILLVSTPLPTKLVAGHWLSGGWPAQCCCRRRGQILVFSSSLPQTDSLLIVVARRGQFPVISSYLPQADSLFGAGRTTIFGECTALLYFTDELEIRISSSRNFKLAKQQYLSRVQSHAHCTLLLNCMLASCIY